MHPCQQLLVSPWQLKTIHTHVCSQIVWCGPNKKKQGRCLAFCTWFCVDTRNCSSCRVDVVVVTINYSQIDNNSLSCEFWHMVLEVSSLFRMFMLFLSLSLCVNFSCLPLFLSLCASPSPLKYTLLPSTNIFRISFHKIFVPIRISSSIVSISICPFLSVVPGFAFKNANRSFRTER